MQQHIGQVIALLSCELGNTYQQRAKASTQSKPEIATCLLAADSAPVVNCFKPQLGHVLHHAAFTEVGVIHTQRCLGGTQTPALQGM
jgi:hypothetical protein